jgi:hypothetical protein
MENGWFRAVVVSTVVASGIISILGVILISTILFD